MKFLLFLTKLFFIGVVLFSTQSFGQITFRDKDGTYYEMDKASADFTLGVILFESYKYTSPEEYKKNRKEGLRNILISAELGYSDAQFYLGNLYLNDSIIKDDAKGIKFLKKAAYQRNSDAMHALDALKIAYTKIPLEKKPSTSPVIPIGLMVLYLGLAVLGHVKVSRSSLMTGKRKKFNLKLTWFLPFIGAIYSIRSSKLLIIPLDQETADWIKEAIDWLLIEFNLTPNKIEMLIPTKESIPINFDGSEKSAFDTLSFISTKMGLDHNSIELTFYDQTNHELDKGLYTRNYEGETDSAGLYFGKNKKGKYGIALEKSKLNQPKKIISTLAHEIAHALLLGQKRIDQNDEYLTDLVPLLFGFGIFAANSAFEFQQGPDFWRYSHQGYLNQQMWGFSFAYLSTLKSNDVQSSWVNHLDQSVREDFYRSMIYLGEQKTAL